MQKELKRQRSQNWINEDKVILRDLIKERIHFIANKHTDSNTNKKKENAWDDLLYCFNQVCVGTVRTLPQVKAQWGLMKLHAKKMKADKIEEQTGSPRSSQPETCDDNPFWLPIEIKIENDSDTMSSDGGKSKQQGDDEGADLCDDGNEIDDITKRRKVQNKIRCQRYRANKKKKTDAIVSSQMYKHRTITAEEEEKIKRRKEYDKQKSQRYRDKKRAKNLINLHKDQSSKTVVTPDFPARSSVDEVKSENPASSVWVQAEKPAYPTFGGTSTTQDSVLCNDSNDQWWHSDTNENGINSTNEGARKKKKYKKAVNASPAAAQSPAAQVAAVETECRQELHKMQMKVTNLQVANEEHKSRILHLEEELQKTKIEYYKRKMQFYSKEMGGESE